MEIAGSVAVVTGASSGIGAAIAEHLAASGATVVGVARREDRLTEVIDACRRASPASSAVVADVSVRTEAEGAVAEAAERHGRVDIVVNNAGISLHKPADETTVDDIERVMSVNFFGAVATTMAALPGMLERGRGSVVNVTSVAGYVPNPNESAYGASKAALSLWSHGLSVDLHGTGVHVGVLSPGPIDTEIWDHEDELDYGGKLHPPSVVAEGAERMIRNELTHLTVPRQFGIPGAIYPLLGRPMRWGLRRFGERRS